MDLERTVESSVPPFLSDVTARNEQRVAQAILLGARIRFVEFGVDAVGLAEKVFDRDAQVIRCGDQRCCERKGMFS